jgi:hypothetical protein
MTERDCHAALRLAMTISRKSEFMRRGQETVRIIKELVCLYIYDDIDSGGLMTEVPGRSPGNAVNLN